MAGQQSRNVDQSTTERKRTNHQDYQEKYSKPKGKNIGRHKIHLNRSPTGKREGGVPRKRVGSKKEKNCEKGNVEKKQKQGKNITCFCEIERASNMQISI